VVSRSCRDHVGDPPPVDRRDFLAVCFVRAMRTAGN